MVEPTEEELMVRFVQGDRQAFDVLYERKAPVVFGYLTKMVRDGALAEDLLQTTFLSVVRSRDRYVVGQPVGPWIIAIAANAARDVLRRNRKRAELMDAHEPVTSVDPVTPDHGSRKRLLDALQTLPESQREVVLLHKVEGWSFEQIGEQLGVTSTAARIRAHRGYEKLRALLHDLEDDA